MSDVKQQIRELRPALREIAPATFYICIGFAILNTVLGISLFTAPVAGSNIVIISKYSPIWVYAILFLLLGIGDILALWRNSWVWVRRTLLFGMLYKSIWFYALLASLFKGGSFPILALWLFLIHIQAVTYIFFTPTIQKKGANNGNTTNF